MSALRLLNQNVKLVFHPLAAQEAMAGPARKDFEIDLGVRIGRDHMHRAAAGQRRERLPAAHQRFGAKQATRVDLAVGRVVAGLPAA